MQLNNAAVPPSDMCCRSSRAPLDGATSPEQHYLFPAGTGGVPGSPAVFRVPARCSCPWPRRFNTCPKGYGTRVLHEPTLRPNFRIEPPRPIWRDHHPRGKEGGKGGRGRKRSESRQANDIRSKDRLPQTGALWSEDFEVRECGGNNEAGVSRKGRSIGHPLGSKCGWSWSRRRVLDHGDQSVDRLAKSQGRGAAPRDANTRWPGAEVCTTAGPAWHTIKGVERR